MYTHTRRHIYTRTHARAHTHIYMRRPAPAVYKMRLVAVCRPPPRDEVFVCRRTETPPAETGQKEIIYTCVCVSVWVWVSACVSVCEMTTSVKGCTGDGWLGDVYKWGSFLYFLIFLFSLYTSPSLSCRLFLYTHIHSQYTLHIYIYTLVWQTDWAYIYIIYSDRERGERERERKDGSKRKTHTNYQ